ncbi:MAG: pyruvate kinase [Bacteroidales bacterium]|nr:pyruvate kinase [Bacteroidales bacterium]
MSKHTKIVATISDKRCDVEFLRELFEAGMNVVRMNSAHLTEEGFQKIISNVRAVSSEIAILMDTKGPEIRTTFIKDDETIQINTGQKIRITGNPDGITSSECIYCSYTSLVEDLSIGTDLLIDDGEIDLRVIEKATDYLVCEAQNDGKLGSRKSVNIPGVRINLPSLTEKDKKNILLAIDFNVDFIAHSFVRNKQDILTIQEILDDNVSPIKIIAKIENQEGVDNIDEILEAAYGIMVARGDLGIEVPQEKIPGIQRMLIRKCVEAKKPVIVATQMLHTMIQNPRPTRAEVTDVANAIYYRTDALMLSGETAYGKYPVEAVKTMSKIAEEAEKAKETVNDIQVPMPESTMNATSFLAQQSVRGACLLGADAIITDSYTGTTARYIAAFRGKDPVYAICYKERTVRQLALSYGVFPIYQEIRKNTRVYLVVALKMLKQKNLIEGKDMVIYLSSSFGVAGGTTFLEINHVDTIINNADHFLLPNFTADK